MARPGRIAETSRRFWGIPWLAVKNFSRMDGAQWAGAFAYYAFFALFPFVILLVTITSLFINRNTAGSEVIGYVETYVPIDGEMQHHIFDTLPGWWRHAGRRA